MRNRKSTSLLLALAAFAALSALGAIVGGLVWLLSGKTPPLDEAAREPEATTAAGRSALDAAPRAIAAVAPERPAGDAKPVGRRLTVRVIDFDRRPRPGSVVHVDIERPPRTLNEA